MYQPVREYWEKYWKVAAPIVLVAAIIAVLVFYPREKPYDPKLELERLKQELIAPYEKKVRDAEVAIQEKNGKIADYQSRLYVSEQKYKASVRKIEELQKEKENVKPPENDQERHDRFADHGLPLLPHKQ